MGGNRTAGSCPLNHSYRTLYTSLGAGMPGCSLGFIVEGGYGEVSSSLIFVKLFASINEVLFWLPQIVRIRIAFPFDEIFIIAAMSSARQDLLNFVFFFFVYNVRWWLIEMDTVGFVFNVRFEHYCMEIVVYFPSFQEFKLVRQIAKLFDDCKGSFGLWLELRGNVHF